MHGCAVGWPVSWSLLLATVSWLEDEAIVRSLEGELRSEEDVGLLLLC